MTTQIINADPQVIKTIAVQSSQVPAPIAPTLAVGDVVNLLVRDNPENALGLIAFKGNLLQATLPTNLQTGDQLVAKVLAANDAVIFKILDIQHPTPQTTALPVVTQVSNLIQHISQQVDTVGVTSLPPLSVTDELQKLGVSIKELAKVFSDLGSAEVITNAKATFESLLSAVDGTLTNSLKDAAQALRNLLQDQGSTGWQRSITALHEELSALLKGDLSDFTAVQKAFSRYVALLDAMGPDSTQHSKKGALDHESLRSIARDLQKGIQNPEQARPLLESALARLDILLANESPLGKSVLNPQLQGALEQLAARLEQLAGTQETLNQLNPLMQTLGEPALILFPFLFQGLLTHSEVTVTSREKGKKQKKDKDSADTNEDDEAHTADSEPFQRVQVSVPLPSLGTVEVDIAHRRREIFVRLTVEDKEVGAFLLEQLENLASILREQGFETAELVASVGSASSIVPAWSLALRPTNSILA